MNDVQLRTYDELTDAQREQVAFQFSAGGNPDKPELAYELTADGTRVLCRFNWKRRIRDLIRDNNRLFDLLRQEQERQEPERQP